VKQYIINYYQLKFFHDQKTLVLA